MALSLFLSHLWMAAALGLIVGSLSVVAYLAIVRRRRIDSFTAQLPDALNIIVRSLRIGHPFVSAIGLAAREMRDPIAAELAMTAEEIAFGQDVTTAVVNLHGRVGQDDLLFLVTAVSVQSQTGGNLAEVLARLATLMRQRSTLQLKVKALSAEGRLSAWFLSAMPFILYGAIRLLSQDYFAELTGSPALVPALVYGGVSLVVCELCHLPHGQFQDLGRRPWIFGSLLFVSAAFVSVAGITFSVGHLITSRNRLQRRLPAGATISMRWR